MTSIDIHCQQLHVATIHPHHLDGQLHQIPCQPDPAKDPAGQFIVRGTSFDNYSALPDESHCDICLLHPRCTRHYPRN